MNTLCKVVVALTLLSVEVLCARPAMAEVGPKDLAAQGVRLRREGKDQEALSIFEEAVRRKPTPRALAQLGLCEQALGLWVASETHILLSLKGAQDPWIKKNEATLRESLSVVQAKLGSIEVWGTPSSARIRLDGDVVATLPVKQPIRVAEGRHVLIIEAPGFLSDTRVLDVRARALTREHVALSASEVMTAPVPPPPASLVAEEPDAGAVTPSSAAHRAEPVAASTEESALPTWRRVLPWSLLAASVAAGSVAVWQHTVWYRGLDRFNAVPACALSAPNRGADARCQGLYDDFSRARTRTFVGYGITGVLGAGAVTLFILNATAKSNDEVSSGSPELGIELGREVTAISFTQHF